MASKIDMATAAATQAQASSILATLSQKERSIIEHLAGGMNNYVFGGPDSPEALVGSAASGNYLRLEDGAVTASGLTAAGWLRLAVMPSSANGNFHLTPAAIRIIRKAGCDVR